MLPDFLEVLDLKTHYETQYFDLFQRLVHQIVEEKADHLWKNYLNLERRIDQFEAFNILFDKSNKEIVAFAAIQSRFFPVGTLRLLSRSYVVPKYRGSNHFPRESTGFLSEYILPWQRQWAKENNSSAIFVSFEKLKRRRFIKSWAKRINEIDIKASWTVPEGVYLTCNNEQESSCWQVVAVDFFGENRDLELKWMSEQEWMRRFEANSTLL